MDRLEGFKMRFGELGQISAYKIRKAAAVAKFIAGYFWLF